MNKIEVNPRLFITCRLCLEDLGLYQIVPAVKEQISYCFDIQVEPFDGLPQLICKKCEVILSNYSAIKKKIIEKQNDLKSKIQGSHNVQFSEAQAEPEGSSENLEFESNNLHLSTKSRKRVACISSSSSELEYDKSFKENEKYGYKNKETPESWPATYTKQYVCRICSFRRLNLKAMKGHINSKHSALNKKYSSIFKRHCEVKLHKTDGKLNITGSRSKVMHSTDRIIKNVNPKYYILYTKEDKDAEICNAKEYESTSSSDNEIVVKRKRIKRLCSRSSNETVVLDSANKLNMSDNEKESRSLRKVQTPAVGEYIINIDDSSDSDTENDKKAKTVTEKQIYELNNEDIKPDQSTINSIIKLCQNKYVKKHYHDNLIMKCNKNPSDIATQLKRKILSIGRKIINKKNSVNCTPLLRFMEHKNLDIAWFPRSIIYINHDSNYIRIMARLKNIGENVDSETGWTDYTSTPNQTYKSFFGDASNSNIGDNFAKASNKEPNNVPNGIDIPEVPLVSVPEKAFADSAILSSDANINGTDTKKLLNANPVANPKQLPKKTVFTEPKSLKVVAKKKAKPLSNIEVFPQENNEFCMPIITSTTSLAVLPFSVEENNDVPSNNPAVIISKNDDQKSEAPRIKVKPVSELMSVETLSRMQEPTRLPCIVSSGQQMSVQNENNVINVYVPQGTVNTVSQFQNTMQPNNVTMSLLVPDATKKTEFMILDTIELPNTKTSSPFQYFRRLLELHNIILLDTDVELSPDFHCLIKFKVMYKQDPSVQPVILCLALCCSKNVFCLKVKDRNQDNLNISRITPNWQWEVLKVFKGEVVNKVLKNAQKIGQDVYEFTNSFLCLLNSINLIKMT